MKRLNLTATIIHALPPSDGRIELGDTKVPALSLRIGPSSKSWTANIKRHGRRYRVSLGTFPSVTVAEARILATKAVGDILSEKHVAATTKRKAALTFATAFEQYMEKIDNPATQRNYRSCFNVHLAPIHKHRLDAITAESVATLHRQITENSPSKANLAGRLVRAVMNHHIRRGAITLTAPTMILSAENRWNRIHRKTRAIPARQVPEFIQRVMALDIVPTAASEAALFALFTGCRAGEVLGLRWQDIDLDVGSFRLPVTKSGRPATMPLITQTREILSRRLVSFDRHPVWVFPSPQKPDRHIVDFRITFERLEADGFGRYSAHDLRRGFAAALDATGCGAYALKRLLNHAQNSDADVTVGYVGSELTTLRRFAQAAGDFLARGGDADEA